uniref:Uncharacterized protein n=1 Tax=Helianthus annuus TaxID=4232 RepID=A0A251TNG3_HELAN
MCFKGGQKVLLECRHPQTQTKHTHTLITIICSHIFYLNLVIRPLFSHFNQTFCTYKLKNKYYTQKFSTNGSPNLSLTSNTRKGVD